MLRDICWLDRELLNYGTERKENTKAPLRPQDVFSLRSLVRSPPTMLYLTLQLFYAGKI